MADDRLLKAAQIGDVEQVKALLKEGADITVVNSDGNNALWFGCFHDNHEIAEALLASGIDINNSNENGVTVMMYSASSGKEKMVKLLLQHNANVQIENLDGFKALDLAATPTIYRLLKDASSTSAN
jgi:ankyrin repeat protein